MTARRILFAAVSAAILLMLTDHLFSPPLQASSGGGTACAPCGAPCPSTR